MCVCECVNFSTKKSHCGYITEERNFLFIYFSSLNKIRMSVNDHLEGILSDFEGECGTLHAMKTSILIYYLHLNVNCTNGWYKVLISSMHTGV